MTWLSLPVLLYIALVDVREYRIPNRAVLVLLLLALGRLLPAWPAALPGALVGAAVFGGPFLLMALAGGAGMGDAKLALVLGLMLGFPAALVALFVAALSGGLVVPVLRAAGRIGPKDPVPYGPFLALAAVAAMLA